MKNEAVKILQKKKGGILEKWFQAQVNDHSLREELMSNEDLRVQSEELIAAIIEGLNDSNIENAQSADFSSVNDMLAAISISRARQGYTPRETGTFIITLKEAFMKTLSDEISD